MSGRPLRWSLRRAMNTNKDLQMTKVVSAREMLYYIALRNFATAYSITVSLFPPSATVSILPPNHCSCDTVLQNPVLNFPVLHFPKYWSGKFWSCFFRSSIFSAPDSNRVQLRFSSIRLKRNVQVSVGRVSVTLRQPLSAGYRNSWDCAHADTLSLIHI